MAKGWVVEIVHSKTGKIEETLGPYDSEKEAVSAFNGVEKNLDHKEFHANVVINSKRSQDRIDSKAPELLMDRFRI